MNEELSINDCAWKWRDISCQFKNIALWGAGSHTVRLLTELKKRGLKLPVLIFDLDSNRSDLEGILVKKPNVKDRVLFDVIILSSRCFQQSMKEDALRIFGDSVECIDLHEKFNHLQGKICR